jgi:hypothetical protein
MDGSVVEIRLEEPNLKAPIPIELIWVFPYIRAPGIDTMRVVSADGNISVDFSAGPIRALLNRTKSLNNTDSLKTNLRFYSLENNSNISVENDDGRFFRRLAIFLLIEPDTNLWNQAVVNVDVGDYCGETLYLLDYQDWDSSNSAMKELQINSDGNASFALELNRTMTFKYFLLMEAPLWTYQINYSLEDSCAEDARINSCLIDHRDDYKWLVIQSCDREFKGYMELSLSAFGDKIYLYTLTEDKLVFDAEYSIDDNGMAELSGMRQGRYLISKMSPEDLEIAQAQQWLGSLAITLVTVICTSILIEH